MHSSDIGVIASGPSYYYAKEIWGENASYLKLGFTNPMPEKKIKEFCSQFDKIYIVEEDDPYIEDFVRKLGILCYDGEKSSNSKICKRKSDKKNTDFLCRMSTQRIILQIGKEKRHYGQRRYRMLYIGSKRTI